MIEIIFLVILAFIWIIFATIEDLKKREIANWLSFSLIIFALGFRFFYSLFSATAQGFSFFYQGLIGLGIFFVLGNLLYYGRMFAGGDAKLMISLGVILPLSETFLINIRIFVLFFLFFLFTGTIYGLIASLYLSLKNFKNFKKQFRKYFHKNKTKFYYIMALALVLMVLGFKQPLFFAIGIFIFIFPYLFIYAKAVDESSMIKEVKTSELREGDWLYKDIKIGKNMTKENQRFSNHLNKEFKVIKANWEGLSKKDIKALKKRYKKILIRQGIAFSPVFLISFLIIVYVYFKIPELLNLFF